ncbi:RDD family protein [Conexibacter woesei]|uniref:RDD family protein n=1 Tax=Conexibacter woesei TaxID=191495 RepID=UPI00041CB761|nr:RDD family protein [Conexibacter woesei]
MSDPSFLAPESPGSTTPPSNELAGFWIRFGASLLDGILLGIVGTILRVVLHGAGEGLSIVLGIAYFTYFEGSTGQTLGKQAANIKVLDEAGGAPIGYGRAFLRYFARILSAIPIFLGYFWMLWDDRNQCWHDKICNDLVVRV